MNDSNRTKTSENRLNKSADVNSTGIKSAGIKSAAKKIDRRSLFTIAGVGFASGVWYKPIINTVVLPAHAQTTGLPNNFFGTDLVLTELITQNSLLDMIVPTAQAGAAMDPETVDVAASKVDEMNYNIEVIFDNNTNIKYAGQLTIGAESSKLPISQDPCNIDSGSASGKIVSVSQDMLVLEFDNGFYSVEVPVGPGSLQDLESCPLSDRRLKTSIQELSENVNGHQLYRFQYLNDVEKKEYVGVMAQDLLDTHPDAVIVAKDNTYRVRYDLLDLKMATYEEWQKYGSDSVRRMN